MTASTVDSYAAAADLILAAHRYDPKRQRCQHCSWTGHELAHRRHVVEMLQYAHDQHVAAQSRSVNAFAKLLAEHVPYYNPARQILLCNECVTNRAGGEFASTTDWAEHIRRLLADAGLRVTHQKGNP